MANKLLNVRMDQEMIEDLKKVCGELEISVTDAIKLFSNKLIKERALPTEEKKEETLVLRDEDAIKDLEDSIEEEKEVGQDQEKYIQLHNDLSEILSFYCKEFGTLVESTTHCMEYDEIKARKKFIVSFDTPFSEIEKTFKEKYEDELKNKILNKITEFYSEYYNESKKQAEEECKIIEEYYKKIEKVENDKYIDVMENLKNENPNLYKELLNKYSYNIDYEEIQHLGFENYNDAKKKLEEFLTPEEIKVLYDCILGSDSCTIIKKTKKEFDNSSKRVYKENDDFIKKNEVLENALRKYYEYINKKNSQNQSKISNSKEK